MRRNVFTKKALSVVCALAVLFLANGSFAQTQRSPTEPDPLDVGWARPTISEQRNVGWALPTDRPPYLSEPSRRTSGSGSGLEGTTPILHESAKLTASDATPRGKFGSSVSISGDTALVGAWSHDCTAGEDCGAAYIFRSNADISVEEQKLVAPNQGAGDWFGYSVAASGDTALIGAPFTVCTSGVRCGSAYVFRFDGVGWNLEQTLTAPAVASGDDFGFSVSLSGETALVGARFETCDAGNACGSAYIFRFDGTHWVEAQKLTVANPGAADGFGHSVSLDRNTAVVGAWSAMFSCAESANCKSVFVFRFDGTSWVEEQQLTAPESAADKQFGASVSLAGNTLVVGAESESTNIPNHFHGSAYVFSFDGVRWTEEQVLNASDGPAQGRYGDSVSTSGNTIVVGSPLDDCDAGAFCGSAYVYRSIGTRWVEELKLRGSDTMGNDTLGRSVVISRGIVIVGSPSDDCVAGNVCGSVYVFEIVPEELEVTIDIKPGSDVNPVNLGARGVLPVAVLTTSVADGDLTDFDASDVDPSSVTLAGSAPRMKGRSGRVGSLADIDGDGDLDLLLHFPIPELELTIDDTEAVLLGQTFDGVAIRGSDTITAIHAQRLDAVSLRRAE